jgi:hypothetical protein
MRHSKIDLTMSVYTDPRLLDVRGALDVLPVLPLNGPQAEGQAALATGTDGPAARTLAPTLAPTPDLSVQTESILDKGPRTGTPNALAAALAVSGNADKGKEPLASAVSGSAGMGATGLEPVTPSVSRFPFAPSREHKNTEIFSYFRISGPICKDSCAVASSCEKTRKFRRKTGVRASIAEVFRKTSSALGST